MRAPLADWRFAGELRHSQRTILDAVHDRIGTGEPLHIVAPPGSGKTLLGLQLAMRLGARTLVLAPTATIRAQWARAAAELAEAGGAESSSDPPPAPQVSEDPAALGELTALTYQMVSVLDTSSPFDTLAAAEWRRELEQAGRAEADAAAWLEELAAANPRAYRAGIRRRGRRIRREVVREDPALLEEGLHPNARALIDRVAAHGVTTIVLDECHHLLDHWALVVHCLVARIRARGAEPTLVGLTATLPSPEDREEFENYSGLLGEVDYELPTPAVVKEGNLAPYRDFAWFVTPTSEEIRFLRTRAGQLDELVSGTLASDDGLQFLVRVLQPGEDPPERRQDAERRLAEAFAADAVIAEAAARMLAQLAPAHPLLELLSADATVPPSTEQRIRLLARYALERILPDPARADTWDAIRRTLADLGFLLTDRGIRRGRDPVDTVLATSVAKERAIGEILRIERASDSGERVRAVAILDFAVHGHGRGGSNPEAAGAMRCFDTVVRDRSLADLRPVLVTAQHLRIAARDADALLPRLGELLGAELEAEPVEPEGAAGDTAVLDVTTPGIGSSRVVAAVSQLVAEGRSSLIVGTRGLLGEGWDCPAVNTLIDLSAVATSSATQQLRGRTLRLDPAWRGKVAHNWTVTAVLEAGTHLDGYSDLRRLERKHDQIWGLALDGPPAVVKGLDHTLGHRQRVLLRRLVAEKRDATVARLNEPVRAGLPSRAETRERWGIGESYLGEARPEVVAASRPRAFGFQTAATVEGIVAVLLLLLVAAGVLATRGMMQAGVFSPLAFVCFGAFALGFLIWAMRKELRGLLVELRRFALPQTSYQGIVLAIARVLHARDEVRLFGRANIVVEEGESTERPGTRYRVSLSGGEPEEQKLVLDALAELFGPIRSPRFVLEVGATDFSWDRPLSALAAKIAPLLGQRSRFFALPRAVGRRRADAQAFAEQWRREVGPCTLHEIDRPEQLALLTRARRYAAGGPRTEEGAAIARREVWA